ncbi:MAG: SCO6745 family protein [Acidimicrobiales bacterium]
MLDQLSARIAKPVTDLPSNFMLDSATYEHGNSLGFDGLDFYVFGRGACLGEVDAGVVSASFVFFNPTVIRERWERAAKVMPARCAAQEFAGCLHRWSVQHLKPGIDYGRVADILDVVLSAASPAAAPLFAGWMTLPEPDDPAELAMHRLNGLRELRGALHGAAVVAEGLDPLVALLVKTPFMAGIFGWREPYPDVELAKDAWTAAEHSTDRAMGRVLQVLDEKEQNELTALLDEMHSAVD